MQSPRRCRVIDYSKSKIDANYKIYIVHSHIQGVASIRLIWVLIIFSIQNGKCKHIWTQNTQVLIVWACTCTNYAKALAGSGLAMPLAT